MLIAGVDEAGRGPLAGPVVAAAVILQPNQSLSGVMDSKKLSDSKREHLFDVITQSVLAYAIGQATVEEIDQLNILQASLLAMRRAVEQLPLTPDEVWVDGNRCPAGLRMPVRAIVGGDASVLAISAASILAKVTRDRHLLELDRLYPHYGFAQHKGYPTAKHRAALAQHGVSAVHRRSYAPVRKFLVTT